MLDQKLLNQLRNNTFPGNQLKFSNQNWDDSAVQELCNALQMNNQALELVLNNCNLTDKSMKHIIDTIKNNKNIIMVDLSTREGVPNANKFLPTSIRAFFEEALTPDHQLAVVNVANSIFKPDSFFNPKTILYKEDLDKIAGSLKTNAVSVVTFIAPYNPSVASEKVDKQLEANKKRRSSIAKKIISDNPLDTTAPIENLDPDTLLEKFQVTVNSFKGGNIEALNDMGQRSLVLIKACCQSNQYEEALQVLLQEWQPAIVEALNFINKPNQYQFDLTKKQELEENAKTTLAQGFLQIGIALFTSSSPVSSTEEFQQRLIRSAAYIFAAFYYDVKLAKGELIQLLNTLVEGKLSVTSLLSLMKKPKFLVEISPRLSKIIKDFNLFSADVSLPALDSLDSITDAQLITYYCRGCRGLLLYLLQQDSLSKLYSVTKSDPEQNSKTDLEREPLHDEDSVKLCLLSLPHKIPSHFSLGSAIGKGDCFFDTAAQQLDSNQNYTVKTLRKMCDSYVKDPKNSWVKQAVERDRDNYDSYLVRLQFTAEEMEENEKNGLNLGPAVWGRPKIEGRILCDIFKIKIHIIEIQEDGKLLDYVVNSQGEEETINPEINYEDPSMLHFVNYHNHYVPLVNNHVQNTGAKRKSKHISDDDKLETSLNKNKKVKGGAIPKVGETSQVRFDFSAPQEQNLSNEMMPKSNVESSAGPSVSEKLTNS